MAEESKEGNQANKDRQEALDRIQEIENRIPTQIVTAEYHPKDENEEKRTEKQ